MSKFLVLLSFCVVTDVVTEPGCYIPQHTLSLLWIKMWRSTSPFVAFFPLFFTSRFILGLFKYFVMVNQWKSVMNRYLTPFQQTFLVKTLFVCEVVSIIFGFKQKKIQNPKLAKNLKLEKFVKFDIELITSCLNKSSEELSSLPCNKCVHTNESCIRACVNQWKMIAKEFAFLYSIETLIYVIRKRSLQGIKSIVFKRLLYLFYFASFTSAIHPIVCFSKNKFKYDSLEWRIIVSLIMTSALSYSLDTERIIIASLSVLPDIFKLLPVEYAAGIYACSLCNPVFTLPKRISF